MHEANGTFALNTPLPVAVTAVTLVLSGCGLVPSLPDGQAAKSYSPVQSRYIEIEVDNLQTGLPCSVIDRRDADTQAVLWRAEFERDFCRRKAEETRSILEGRGWTCEPHAEDERQGLLQRLASWPSKARTSAKTRVVAAWRCIEGDLSIKPQQSARPPVPAAKPDLPENQIASWGNEPLQEAVERDLSTIGQDVIGEESTLDAAFGDLNDDGRDDAIVVLTRNADRGASHRMLMAYLRNDQAYNLVDVWILSVPDQDVDGGVTLAIEDGAVRLETCCEDQADPTILVLDNRKLAYAQGG